MSSEEPLHPELDGTGGGFGKFKGKTVRELSELFDRVATEPNMRSVSAVLRIAREQIEARGSLGMYPMMAAIAGVVAIGGAVGYYLVPSGLKEGFLKGGLGGLVAAAAFLAGVISTRRETRAALAQERAIRDLAIDALARIAEDPGFKAKALDYDQRRILTELLKRSKRQDPAVTALLDAG